VKENDVSKLPLDHPLRQIDGYWKYIITLASEVNDKLPMLENPGSDQNVAKIRKNTQNLLLHINEAARSIDTCVTNFIQWKGVVEEANTMDANTLDQEANFSMTTHEQTSIPLMTKHEFDSFTQRYHGDYQALSDRINELSDEYAKFTRHEGTRLTKLKERVDKLEYQEGKRQYPYPTDPVLRHEYDRFRKHADEWLTKLDDKVKRVVEELTEGCSVEQQEFTFWKDRVEINYKRITDLEKGNENLDKWIGMVKPHGEDATPTRPILERILDLEKWRARHCLDAVAARPKENPFRCMRCGSASIVEVGSDATGTYRCENCCHCMHS
jgi:polyhydroxyalkanoate synthesis regulator phasin